MAFKGHILTAVYTVASLFLIITYKTFWLVDPDWEVRSFCFMLLSEPGPWTSSGLLLKTHPDLNLL